ncbi:MAG TPA: FxSxx-COOH cyclophane-containing RiPP peptide [Streptosporangiaceae bacterium]|nr:FxSxx-COOH cyclophane-containing RiPP peptide [Streptosporangiaceae bacterium]
MIATDDKRSEYPSDLADLRLVPLADVSALSEDVLRRVVPAALAGQVPVAAFNSSI